MAIPLELLRLYMYCPMAYVYRKQDKPYTHISQRELLLRILHRLLKDNYVARAIKRKPLSSAELHRKASVLWAKYCGYAPQVSRVLDLMDFHNMVQKAMSYEEPLAVDYPVIYPLPCGQELHLNIDFVALHEGIIHGVLLDPVGFYTAAPLNLLLYREAKRALRSAFYDYKVRVYFLAANGQQIHRSLKEPDVSIIDAAAQGISKKIFFAHSHADVCKNCYYYRTCKYSFRRTHDDP